MIQLIDRITDEKIRRKAINRLREKEIVLPTFAQMKDPDLIPDIIKSKLAKIGLWDRHPLNLFRITWKNEPVETGGGFGSVNFLELHKDLTGVDARIVLLIGKWFPTGAHKVGAAYGCLVPRLVTGGFDPAYNKAVWPSTGNFCRGGAFDSYLMGCTAVAVLPEEMSRERFEWLKKIGAEIIASPGCESNVKEIYDICWDIRKNRPECVIFNQFEEFGNSCWHHSVTGPAVIEVFESLQTGPGSLSAYVSATGSAGTIAAGDYLKTVYPRMVVVASEALQCPTLLMAGFGAHRIEGIGDKHVPWIHNVRSTDAVAAIDDEDCIRLFRLFNEPEGKSTLIGEGVSEDTVTRLDLLGISSISSMITAIKTAKYFEMTGDDIIISVATDSADLYRSRLSELAHERGEYNRNQAVKDMEKCLMGIAVDHFKELSYYDRKAVHNLKYFTWVEQQKKSIKDLNQLWQDRTLWDRIYSQIETWDRLIEEFNEETGVLENLKKA
ncbi:MAG: pyridoxal-phosphate dependent enzyme [Deltaproteobacteria bacterium]|nr:pyridoxal-phosphate dependent enzyme [Deltaproteobacteria bacterium]MBW2154710.1 pyridoxal-phosphate dependent enzyme [Deltaproteobacteria bacterium]